MQTFIALIFTTLVPAMAEPGGPAPVPPLRGGRLARQEGPTFEEAKKDESKRLAWLAGAFGKLVHDKDKNPGGLYQAWFYLKDEAHAKQAREAIKAEYTAQGVGYLYAREIDGLWKAAEADGRKVAPVYLEDSIFGSRERTGILLVGDVFAFESGEDVRCLADYLGTLAELREKGLTIGDRQIDTYTPIMRTVSHACLLDAYAASLLMEKTLKKERTVSAGFRGVLQKHYLSNFGAFSRSRAEQQKIYDDNNENTLQMEIVDFLNFVRTTLEKRMEGAGFKHVPVEAGKHEFRLEPK